MGIRKGGIACVSGLNFCYLLRQQLHCTTTFQRMSTPTKKYLDVAGRYWNWIRLPLPTNNAFKHHSSTGRLLAARGPAYRLHWQGRVSPLAVASPSAPAFALGLFYWGNGFNLLHQYLCPWVLRVKPPVSMALLHLTVVLVDQPLHQVEDQ